MRLKSKLANSNVGKSSSSLKKVIWFNWRNKIKTKHSHQWWFSYSCF